MKDRDTSSIELLTTRLTTISAPAPDRKGLIQIKTILVPIDFSRESFRALEYIVPIARKFASTIHVVHVRPFKEANAIEHAEHLMLNYTDVVDFLQDRLADVQRKHALEFSPDQCHVSAGRPFEEICKAARELDADLIALPTRGQSGLKRVLMGSTAERVIRYSPCPVLIPRGKSYTAAVANQSGKTDLAIGNILVPVDFSECSVAGLKYASFLGQKFKAKLRLFHAVYPPADVMAPDRSSGNLFPPSEAAMVAARAEMKEFKRRYLARNLSCETEVVTGYPVDQICAQSASAGTDLIVTSTHGRTGFRHALIGSVAEQVARYADCPVLIVPSKPRI